MKTDHEKISTYQCRHIWVFGVVQGVGFRPFVFRLARSLRLCGWVRNTASGVEIHVQGESAQIETLIARLRSEAPPLARVDRIEHTAVPDESPDDDFVIRLSNKTATPRTIIGHDSGVCESCLAELFDPDDRRWRYPFINCTQCGPRYTITRQLPYDRATTSMSGFTLCPLCQAEYDDPGNRRFHAEATACPVCGPALDNAGHDDDAIARTLAQLLAGEIVAIKGLGGFHLACDARNAATVARLRQRKMRDEKPFALMAANLASARQWASIDDEEARLLSAPERPIVLLDARNALPGIAPGLHSIGIMLPYTPLQYLLFHEYLGRPSGVGWLDRAIDLILVMTSANPGGEPLVIDNTEAQTRLAGIADHLLTHNRAIVCRCDDTVLRARPGQHGAIHLVRRARSYTPRAIALDCGGAPVLALGAHFKNTVCVMRGDEAFLSAHIGDLDNAASCRALRETVDQLQRLLDFDAEIIVHDRHPDFFSSRLAQELAAGRPCVAVQHHHAHIAAVLAEHRRQEPVLGLALDGVGLGEDGHAWGGELLLVDRGQARRLGHLAWLALPGGDRAAHEPWRMAAAVLHRLGRENEIASRFAQYPSAADIAQLLGRPALMPQTSSLGRYFDAAAALLHVCDHNHYEAQAAMRLEALAIAHGPVAALDGAWSIDAALCLDLLPLFDYLSRLPPPRQAYGAALFHATLSLALADWVARAAAQERLRTVAFGGGCFLNTLLHADLQQRLCAAGLTVLTSCQAPVNDGGIALGQAWVARQLATA